MKDQLYRTEALPMRNDLFIRSVENGWIIEVGTSAEMGVAGRRVVFTKMGDLQDALPLLLGPVPHLPTVSRSEPQNP